VPSPTQAAFPCKPESGAGYKKAPVLIQTGAYNHWRHRLEAMQGVKKIPVLKCVKGAIGAALLAVFTILFLPAFSKPAKNVVMILICLAIQITLLLVWVCISWFEDRCSWTKDRNAWKKERDNLVKEKNLMSRKFNGQTLLRVKAEKKRDNAEKIIERLTESFSIMANSKPVESQRKDVTNNGEKISDS
ncbi:MAG: hypothetical protein L0K75_11715, partial [Enterococcaceae bacterium]|nr:hypothetical protein [Enterococcaceae bacterium]